MFGPMLRVAKASMVPAAASEGTAEAVAGATQISLSTLVCAAKNAAAIALALCTVKQKRVDSLMDLTGGTFGADIADVGIAAACAATDLALKMGVVGEVPRFDARLVRDAKAARGHGVRVKGMTWDLATGKVSWLHPSRNEAWTTTRAHGGKQLVAALMAFIATDDSPFLGKMRECAWHPVEMIPLDVSCVLVTKALPDLGAVAPSSGGQRGTGDKSNNEQSGSANPPRGSSNGSSSGSSSGSPSATPAPGDTLAAAFEGDAGSVLAHLVSLAGLRDVAPARPPLRAVSTNAPREAQPAVDAKLGVQVLRTVAAKAADKAAEVGTEVGAAGTDALSGLRV
jgi:hypothetical protein